MDNKEKIQQQLQNLRQVQGVLRRIYTEAGTHGVYLVDESGFLIAEAGKIDLDRVALAALVAASFGATAEIAKLVGEHSFTQLTQQGENRNLFICKAGKRHIVIAVFGRETNLGLVKLYVEQAVIHLGALLDYVPPTLTKVEDEELETVTEEAPVDMEISDTEVEERAEVEEKINEQDADLLKSFREFVDDESTREASSFKRIEEEETTQPEMEPTESISEAVEEDATEDVSGASSVILEEEGESEEDSVVTELPAEESAPIEEAIAYEAEADKIEELEILEEAAELVTTETESSEDILTGETALDLEMHEEPVDLEVEAEGRQIPDEEAVTVEDHINEEAVTEQLEEEVVEEQVAESDFPVEVSALESMTEGSELPEMDTIISDDRTEDEVDVEQKEIEDVKEEPTELPELHETAAVSEDEEEPESLESDETQITEIEESTDIIPEEQNIPEITQLTQELKSEIEELVEESKKLELKLSQPFESEAETGREETPSPETIADLETPTLEEQAEVEQDVGMAVDTEAGDNQFETHTEEDKMSGGGGDDNAEKDDEPKQDEGTDNAFPSWLDEKKN